MKVSTKLKAGEAASSTELNIDWDGMSTQDVQDLATQALIVKAQARWRKAGTIPETADLKASDYKVGARAPRLTIEQQVVTMSTDDRKALIAKLQASLAG